MKKSVLRSYAYLLLASAVGVGTILLLLYRGSAPETHAESSSLKQTTEPAISVADSPAASRDSLDVEEVTGARLDHSTEFSAQAKKDNFSNSPTTGVLTGHEIDDPNAVIGQPFPISESVRSGCERQGKDSPCWEDIARLAQMAEEPRDPRWATATEASLQEWVERSGEFSIRAIECRTSWCAVEVASLYGPLVGFNYGDPPYGSLFNGIPLFGYETDPSSARVTVTVLTFKRR